MTNSQIIKRKCFPQPILEEVSKILCDTKDGLTGSQIGHFLLQTCINDVSPEMTKWKRLFNAFVGNQNKSQYSNDILKFISLALAPSRFVKNSEAFEEKRQMINQQLCFIGYTYNENGNYSEVEIAKTISDAQKRADSLKNKLEQRSTHPLIFRYCKAELLANNYFHSVFEASKGLFQRIRDLSLYEKDGNELIEYVFSKNPILIINNYQSDSEKNEHNGFCNILKGLCGMFRNPEAHEPKIDWRLQNSIP